MRAAQKPPAKARPHGNTHVGLVVLKPMRAAGVPPEESDDPRRVDLVDGLVGLYHASQQTSINRHEPDAGDECFAARWSDGGGCEKCWCQCYRKGWLTRDVLADMRRLERRR